MKRQYPRFLYSNPKKSKSSGPFIVHLLDPRIVFRVTFNEADVKIGINGEYTGFTGVVLLDEIKYSKEIRNIALAAVVWFEGNLEEGLLDIKKTDAMIAAFTAKGLSVKVIKKPRLKPGPANY
jgi:hypothetical protein